jgi:hypothetical protein
VSPITDDDLDLLADYCAGLLKPAEAAHVETLITTDPGWAQAHASLMSALPGIEAALSAMPQEPVPADVAARLDRALAASGAGTESNVVDIFRARRWRRAALTTAAVAAGAVAIIGGLAALGAQHSTSNSATSSGAKAAPGPAQAYGRVPPTLATGTDYTHSNLRYGILGPTSGRAPDAAVVPAPSLAPRSGAAGAGALNSGPPAAVPPALSRLTDPTQLRTCLDEIVAAQGGQVVAVDYARYQGAPALIVALTGSRITVVAAGPDCGLPGAGPAIIDSAP